MKNLYDKLIEAQQRGIERPRLRVVKDTFVKARKRKAQVKTLDVCKNCASEWPARILIQGCPTCKAMGKHNG